MQRWYLSEDCSVQGWPSVAESGDVLSRPFEGLDPS
jgi:hypothetical protein